MKYIMTDICHGFVIGIIKKGKPYIVVTIFVLIVVILDLRLDRRRDHCLFILPDNDRKDDKGKD